MHRRREARFTPSTWVDSQRACQAIRLSTYRCSSKLKVYIFQNIARRFRLILHIAFNEFIHERETTKPTDPSIRLFDEIILAKKNRGRTSFFSKSSTTFLSDTSDHLWRSATVPMTGGGKFPGDYKSVVSRIPAKLDPTLMKEPKSIQGVPRVDKGTGKVGRKAVPSMLGMSSKK